MPRLGLDTAAVITAAAEIGDDQGVDAVTLARVADRPGQAGRDALSAAAGAYRRYAHEHPGRYGAMQRAPLGVGEDAEAAAELYGVIHAALTGYRLRGAAEVHAIRAVRAGLRGVVSLEQVGGMRMRMSLDASYAGLVEMLHLGLTALGASTRAPGDAGG